MNGGMLDVVWILFGIAGMGALAWIVAHETKRDQKGEHKTSR